MHQRHLRLNVLKDILRESVMENIYKSPFSGRYSSEEMLRLFSKRTRHETWRRLWVELARAERELGLPIRQEQVDELVIYFFDSLIFSEEFYGDLWKLT